MKEEICKEEAVTLNTHGRKKIQGLKSKKKPGKRKKNRGKHP